MSIDISALLAPISEHAPCGIDYSFSNEFHLIKKSRIEDDNLLDQGDWVSERKQADWELVIRTASELMCKKSKDIRLLSWLTEAWSNQFGFEGIAKGLELSHLLLNQYWLTLHPEIEDEDLDQRIGLLQGLINQLPPLIKKVPIINSEPFYNFLDYENFLYHQNIRRKQSDDHEQQEQVSELEQFEQAVSNTSKNFQHQNFQAFSNVLEHWQTLKMVLDELMEVDAPSFANVDSNFNDIHQTLKKIYRTEILSSTTPTEKNHQSTPNTSFLTETVRTQPIMISNQTVFQPQMQNHLTNREQAMKVLQDIADYFRTNEPHSPVSYMLQKTIKWSQMPLHEWLTQVVKEENSLQMIQETLDVQPKNEYE